MQKYLVGFTMLLCISAMAQKIQYYHVDSVTYYLYEHKMWDKLKEYRKVSKKKAYNFHYLNLRIGLAYFESNQFLKAEKYFYKAYKQNPTSKVTAEYLYATALKNQNTFLAGKLHSMATNDTVKFTQLVSSINLESGIKFSSNKAIAGNVNYYSFGIGHLPFKNVALYHSYMYQNQNNNNWGEYKQHQYYLGTSVYLGNNWSLDVGTHLHQYNSNLFFLYDTTQSITTPPKYPGDYKVDSTHIKHNLIEGSFNQMGAYFYVGLTKRNGRFKFSPFFQLNLETNSSSIFQTRWIEENVIRSRPYEPNLPTNESSVFKDTSITDFYVPSTLQSRTIGFNAEFATRSERLKIGFTFYKPFGDYFYRLTFSPYLTLNISKITFSLSYFNKPNIGFTENYGSFLNNTYDWIHHRMNFSTSYHINQKLMVRLLYQFENKTDILTIYRYSTNMLSLSFQLNL